MKETTGGKTNTLGTNNAFITQQVTPSALSAYTIPSTPFFEDAVITPLVTLESYCQIVTTSIVLVPPAASAIPAEFVFDTYAKTDGTEKF